jgi:hypothetical protein
MPDLDCFNIKLSKSSNLEQYEEKEKNQGEVQWVKRRK